MVKLISEQRNFEGLGVDAWRCNSGRAV